MCEAPVTPMRRPRGITFSPLAGQQRSITMEIHSPESNMQTDKAAFEGWALALKARGDCDNIILKFNPYIKGALQFVNLDKEQQHYMRFLYRVSKFSNQMKRWFSVDSSNKKIIDKFERQFYNINKLNNIPSGPSAFNPAKGKEHVVEKIFVSCVDQKKKIDINFELFDQLPIGIFNGVVARNSKIFNTGFFDLWGIENNRLQLFELKIPGNNKIGIISELFFYANVASDLLNSTNNFLLNSKTTEHRGYKNLLNKEIKNIDAYFLVSSVHSEIENNLQIILAILNSQNIITYHQKEYNIPESEINTCIRALQTRH